MPEPIRPWRVERYRDGLEEEILTLFRNVFGRQRSAEHWHWQFKANPYGGPFSTIARRVDDGAVVGSYSVMPIMLNLMGKPLLACQSVDTAVHPDHRGQRVFEQTATDCYAWCASSGIKAVLGFPNAISYQGLVRTLDWRRVGFPVQYVLRMRMAPVVRRAVQVPLLPALVDLVYRPARRAQLAVRGALLSRLSGSDVVFRIAPAVPDGYDALWDAWRSQEVLSVWKDANYLRWRYDQNPDYRFTYFFLARGDEILAQAVGLELEGALTLCELLVGRRDRLVGQRLVVEICQYAAGRGLRSVKFLGFDAGFFDEVFKGLDRQSAWANVFCARSFDAGILGELLPNPANWTITFGDCDFV